jgi:hypothetical protein
VPRLLEVHHLPTYSPCCLLSNTDEINDVSTTILEGGRIDETTDWLTDLLFAGDELGDVLI